MIKTWVVVADSSAARIYSRPSRSSLELVESLSHPESRIRSGDIYTDAPGRVQSSQSASRHGVSPRTDPHVEESRRFAREIAGRLETEHQRKTFGKLVIMAPPAFLGALRAELSKGVADAVTGEVHKNLLAQDEADIIAHIP